jgi:hypothetical protein
MFKRYVFKVREGIKGKEVSVFITLSTQGLSTFRRFRLFVVISYQI